MNIEDIFDMLVSSDYPIDGTWTVDQLTNFIVNSGIDITEFTQEDIEHLLNMCADVDPTAPDIGDSSSSSLHEAKGSQVSFTGAGRCWWCSGSGVVWSGGQNVKCSHCGGSGIGPE